MSGDDEKFYTVRGYELRLHDGDNLTPSMEDYLEMICRLSRDQGFTRVSDLAQALNVQPPSATNMVQKLADGNYLTYRKYGAIQLTPRGKELGTYLLMRHETIAEFLALIGVKEGLLEETERMEHSISRETVERIHALVQELKARKRDRPV